MILLGVSLLSLSIDQITKVLILRRFHLEESLPIIPGFLNFTYIQNSGAAFGFMSNMPALARIPFFLAVTIAAGFIVYAYQRFLPSDRILARAYLGLIWGGAMGNCVDRILYGKVVDFVEVYQKSYHFYVFNVADACISVGITLLILDYLFGKPRAEEL
jgi:signal peptidase II